MNENVNITGSVLNAPGDADIATVATGIRAENSGRKQQSYLRLLRDKEENK